MIRCGHVQIQNLQEQIIRLSFEILAGNSLILLDSATTPFLALTRNVPVIRFQLPSPSRAILEQLETGLRLDSVAFHLKNKRNKQIFAS